MKCDSLCNVQFFTGRVFPPRKMTLERSYLEICCVFLDQISAQLLLSHLSVMSIFEMGSLVGFVVLLFPWDLF